MTDKEFISYLALKLLNSGEDCCSVCAYNTDRAADCDNLKAHDVPNDDICLKGLRAYANKNIAPTNPIEQILKDLQDIQTDLQYLAEDARAKLATLAMYSEPYRQQSKQYVVLESVAAYVFSARKYLVELKG